MKVVEEIRVNLYFRESFFWFYRLSFVIVARFKYFFGLLFFVIVRVLGGLGLELIRLLIKFNLG